MLQIELKNANEHIAYLTNLTGEKLKTFGITLMKVEEDFIDLGDGTKIKVILLFKFIRIVGSF
jgi:hypothetical protein